jgi:hypothetical protein
VESALEEVRGREGGMLESGKEGRREVEIRKARKLGSRKAGRREGGKAGRREAGKPEIREAGRREGRIASIRGFRIQEGREKKSHLVAGAKLSHVTRSVVVGFASQIFVSSLEFVNSGIF